MGIVMQKGDTITQHERAFASNGFTMAQRLFPFPEVKERLPGTSDNDVKTAAENWLNGQGLPTVEGQFLNITKVSRLHMAAYLCIASNGIPPAVNKDHAQRQL
ncbi:hypothetical protein AVEN_194299-1, partial [Araneus ventricosus]